MHLSTCTVALVVTAASIAGAGTANAQGRFDGLWSVQAVTLRGDCDRAYRYDLTVRNGQASFSGLESAGRVASNGAVRGFITAGGARADVVGRLSRASGSGTWTATGARSCAGRWSAERRG